MSYSEIEIQMDTCEVSGLCTDQTQLGVWESARGQGQVDCFSGKAWSWRFQALGVLLDCWLGLLKPNLPMEAGWRMSLVTGLKLLETPMGWAGNGRVWDRCNKMQGKEPLQCPGV